MRSEGQFNLNGLSRRIDDTRRERDLTWSEIAQQVGVATSTIRRFATASDAEADGVLALIGWLGVAPEQFVIDSAVTGTLLLSTREGMIRVDMPLIAEQPTWPRRSPLGTRTTIQRLVTAAQAANATIASLTRWSPV